MPSGCKCSGFVDVNCEFGELDQPPNPLKGGVFCLNLLKIFFKKINYNFM
jgi:hypothetical protein